MKKELKMRQLNLMILCISIVFNSLAANATESYRMETKESHKIQRARTTSFISHDGARLKYIINLPSKRYKRELFPVVILVNPLGIVTDAYKSTPAAELLASRGIAVAMLNTRGHIGSEGIATVASKKERDDVSALITHLIKSHPIDKDKIGIGGVSQGAALSIFSAAQDPRIKVVVAGSPWTVLLKTAFYENNSVNSMWANILPVPFGMIGGSFLRTLRETIHTNPASPLLKALEDERNAYDAVKVLNKRQIPVFLVGNHDESLFPLKNTIELYKSLNTPKKLEIGRGDHAGIEMVKPMIRKTIGDSVCPDNDDIWPKLAAWYLYWLKGEEASILAEDRIHAPIKFSNCLRDSFDNFDFNTEENKFFFSSNGKLVASVEDVKDTESQISVISTPETFKFATQTIISNIYDANVIKGHTKDLREITRKNSFVFVSDKFSRTEKLRTDFHLNMNVKSDHHLFQLFFYVFKKDTNSNTAKLLSLSPYSNVKPSADGMYKLKFKMDFISDDINEGEQIVVVADTRHLQYQKKSEAKTITLVSTKENPSYISFKSRYEVELEAVDPSETSIKCESNNGRGYGRFFKCGNEVCSKK